VPKKGLTLYRSVGLQTNNTAEREGVTEARNLKDQMMRAVQPAFSSTLTSIRGSRHTS
jgi:hypothetical protein